MTIKALYPSIRPALDLNFARTKALDPRITYTRASTGTFVGSDGLIKTAAINAPRFDHNPTTGESLGLLVEEARTNTWTRSEEFNDAVWTKTDTTVTSNAATAPDGSLTADKLIASATTAVHSMQRVKGLNSPSWTTIYLKAAEYTICDVRDINLDTVFRIDLTSGALSESPAFVGKLYANQYGVDAVGNGWYRIRIGRSTADGVINNPVLIYPNGAASYLGDGTSGIFIWGAQAEASAFPTSYIPTTTATVTRAADVTSISGTNYASFINYSEGTWVSSVPNVNGTGGRIFDSRSSILFASANTNGYSYASGGASQVSASYPLKGAVVYNSTDVHGVANGSINTGNTGGRAISHTYIDIGSANTAAAGVGFLNGPIARLTYYPVRLPDAQLQALTQ